MREGTEDIFRQSLPRRPLESVNTVQQAPQLERGRIDNVEIPDEVNEACIREKFQKKGNAADVRRRFEDQAASSAPERPLPHQAEKSRLPASLYGRRQTTKVEQIGVGGRMIGEGDASIRRRLPEQTQGEFILLRPVPAGSHLIHGPAYGHQPAQKPRQPGTAQQEVMRSKAFVSGRRGMTGIMAEQFVQQSRARTPVAEDEERTVLDRRTGHTAAKDCLLRPTQQCMSGAYRRDDQGDRPARIMDSEAMGH